MNESGYYIIRGQQIHEIAFLHQLGQYLSFLNIFFNRFSLVEKCGATPYCLHRDSLNLIYYIFYIRRRTIDAPKLVPKNSTVKISFFINRCFMVS